MTKTTSTTTHEIFIQRVRDLVVADSELTPEQHDQLSHAKLVYGVGDGSYRGVCWYKAWQNGIGTVDVIEIAATAEESWIQLASTTIHELAHVLAGSTAGHSSDWKSAAMVLGFTKRPEAAGQVYRLAMLRPALRFAIARLAAELNDGSPTFARIPTFTIKIRPCSAGVGTRGGSSRGKGSGSRMRLWECECERPVKVRVASDNFAAHCDICGSAFTRKS